MISEARVSDPDDVDHREEARRRTDSEADAKPIRYVHRQRCRIPKLAGERLQRLVRHVLRIEEESTVEIELGTARVIEPGRDHFVWLYPPAYAVARCCGGVIDRCLVDLHRS